VTGFRWLNSKPGGGINQGITIYLYHKTKEIMRDNNNKYREMLISQLIRNHKDKERRNQN
jgi:hypothetical protein